MYDNKYFDFVRWLNSSLNLNRFDGTFQKKISGPKDKELALLLLYIESAIEHLCVNKCQKSLILCFWGYILALFIVVCLIKIDSIKLDSKYE